ncbi:homeobox protein Hox-B4-like isoform X2 [Agrilus planipennis]|uniref:Homeobox protein Hox-B4-like isoform X2 n=1 Tax=Agrilus planipennis TaxID=224129 RepID=A0A1W4WDN4_AGRPL|nr:homeobox protein Hox-B4-like isoform X2 [Agrilus planipennis]
MEGYNVNTNMFNYGNYDPELYNLYQTPLLDPFNTRPSSVSSYQTSGTPNSVDDLSEQSQLEQTFSPAPQSTSTEETQTYETQWTQPFLNSHYHGYYAQNTAAIAPYMRGYSPHWAAMGNYIMEHPWYRYNQNYLPVSLQQQNDTPSESTWSDNSSTSTFSIKGTVKESADLCSENLEPEKLVPQSIKHFTNLPTEVLQSPSAHSSSSSSPSIPSDVIMSQPKNGNTTGNGQTKVSGRTKGKTVFTYEQRAILEKAFAEGNCYLARNKRILLAKQLKVDERNVRVWFQNRRVKAKRERERKLPIS